MRYLLTAVLCIALITIGCGEESPQLLPILPEASEDFIAGAPEKRPDIFDPNYVTHRVEVCLIYFEPGSQDFPPSDADFREYHGHINNIVNRAQRFFADEMERHGYGRKTFKVLRESNRQVHIRRIKGEHPLEDYLNTPGLLEQERVDIANANPDYFNHRINVWFLDFQGMHGCGWGGGHDSWGKVSLVAGMCWNWQTLVHELGHAMGLSHDFRDDAFIMSYGGEERKELSAGAAKWLNYHRAFTAGRPVIAFFSLTEILPELIETTHLGGNRYRFEWEMKIPYYPKNEYSKRLVPTHCVTVDTSSGWKEVLGWSSVDFKVISGRRWTENGPRVFSEVRNTTIIECEVKDETTHIGIEMMSTNGKILNPLIENNRFSIK